MTYDNWKTCESELDRWTDPKDEDLAAADELICRLKNQRDDLLDALEAIVATVDRAQGKPVTFFEGMKDCSVTKARAAIARAKGEA